MKGVEKSFQRGDNWYVIHKQAAWLCLFCMLMLGLLIGFFIGLAVLI